MVMFCRELWSEEFCRLDFYQDFEKPQWRIKAPTELTKLQYMTNYWVQSGHVIAGGINSYLQNKPSC